jgi:hypothetical protein
VQYHNLYRAKKVEITFGIFLHSEFQAQRRRNDDVALEKVGKKLQVNTLMIVLVRGSLFSLTWFEAHLVRSFAFSCIWSHLYPDSKIVV